MCALRYVPYGIDVIARPGAVDEDEIRCATRALIQQSKEAIVNPLHTSAKQGATVRRGVIVALASIEYELKHVAADGRIMRIAMYGRTKDIFREWIGERESSRVDEYVWRLNPHRLRC